jgi:D-aspartate ligase
VYLLRTWRLGTTMTLADVFDPDPQRDVTVFDIDLPPALAFIRSLGRAGVPVVASSARPTAAGRLSRHATAWRRCPPVQDCERFIDWLTHQLGSGAIDLVAPTSDWVMFCVAEAIERLGRPAGEVGHPDPDNVRTCLVKDRFASAMGSCGFPSPPAGVPTSLRDALRLAGEIGYPVVLKPRSHVGIGTYRGVVIHGPDELRAAYRPFVSGLEHRSVQRRVPGLCLPLLQRYYELGTVDIISITGCLAGDEVLALHHARKIAQAPIRLGVGSMFEAVGPQPFTAAAVEAVRGVLGSGIFELEVLVERATGEYHAIDLNPRGFGQMTLDMAAGHDLPRLWYRAVTGTRLTAGAPATSPRFWHDGVSSYAGLAVGVARGPGRIKRLGDAVDVVRSPKVGAAFAWTDPLPGVVFGLGHLRHPRAFLRQFFVDVECPAGPAASADGRRFDALPRSA